MSLVKVQGNASGTGIFTIASPNGNTDRTLTLPDNTGTILTTATPGVPVNGPAFSAYQSTPQTAFTAATQTKILFQTEEFDTNSNYDTATSRFTPTVAGYYQVNAAWTASTAYAFGQITIYKNGAAAKLGNSNGFTANSSNAWTVNALIYMNGSTDYLEAYGLSSVSQAPSNSALGTYFQAFLARSA
jgi:hypothetical protein